MSQTPTKGDPRPAAARAWWTRLKEGGDRANLARLRRAATPLEALAIPATGRLARDINLSARAPEDMLARLGVLAHVLAHVREDRVSADWHAFPRALGQRRPGATDEDARIYSALRFRRLTKATDDIDFMNQLRRAVAILDGKADVESLARFVLGADDAHVMARAILAYHEGPIATDGPSPAASDAA